MFKSESLKLGEKLQKGLGTLAVLSPNRPIVRLAEFKAHINVFGGLIAEDFSLKRQADADVIRIRNNCATFPGSIYNASVLLHVREHTFTPKSTVFHFRYWVHNPSTKNDLKISYIILRAEDVKLTDTGQVAPTRKELGTWSIPHGDHPIIIEYKEPIKEFLVFLGPYKRESTMAFNKVECIHTR
jgi:hypothetical protein